jgi:hypothetical protein
MSPLKRSLLGGVIILFGGLSWLNAASLPEPTSNEWHLVSWLHERIPNGSVVRFDSATYHLAPVAMCPMGAHVELTPQPLPVSVPARQGIHDVLEADYIVTSFAEDVREASFVHNLEGGFYVGRQADLPHPVDVRFGDLLYVLSYQLVSSVVAPGETVHVRLDYQPTSIVTSEALTYSAFIHITLPGQPGEKIVDYSVPFIEEIGTFAPRQWITNDHHRFSLPADTAPGAYDVIFGIFNHFTGERLRWLEGDSLLLGQLEVSE